jgi:RNA polymerase sigma factor (sigma-70 family)
MIVNSLCTEMLTMTETEVDSTSVDVTAVTRLKHAELWQACKGFCHGRYGGQSALARHLGVPASEFGMWLNLKSCPPQSPTRGWSEERLSKLESQLIELTGKTLEQLFPDELRRSVEFLQAPKVYEQTASLKTDALEHYAIATAERMRLSASPMLPSEHDELTNDVRRALDVLTHRERQVVAMRYGLADGHQYTLEEVSAVLRVTRERVRQIEAKAIRNLQKPGVKAVLEERWA